MQTPENFGLCFKNRHQFPVLCLVPVLHCCQKVISKFDKSFYTLSYASEHRCTHVSTHTQLLHTLRHKKACTDGTCSVICQRTSIYARKAPEHVLVHATFQLINFALNVKIRLFVESKVLIHLQSSHGSVLPVFL